MGQEPLPPDVKIDPAIDMKTPPKSQVDTMTAGRFRLCGRAAQAASAAHHRPADHRATEAHRLRAGQSFDLDAADPAVKKGSESAPEDAQKLMEWKIPTMARVANGWSMNTDTMGVYGNYYLKRAMVAQVGLGANLPEDAIYPFNLVDDDGKPLDGANIYTIHFDKGEYRQLKPSGRSRFTTLTGSRSQLAQPLRGQQLDAVQIQPRRLARPLFPEREPGRGQGTNWLPAPRGPYNLTMRVYAPKSDALTGKWNSAARCEGADRSCRS